MCWSLAREWVFLLDLCTCIHAEEKVATDTQGTTCSLAQALAQVFCIHVRMVLEIDNCVYTCMRYKATELFKALQENPVLLELLRANTLQTPAMSQLLHQPTNDSMERGGSLSNTSLEEGLQKLSLQGEAASTTSEPGTAPYQTPRQESQATIPDTLITGSQASKDKEMPEHSKSGTAPPAVVPEAKDHEMPEHPESSTAAPAVVPESKDQEMPEHSATSTATITTVSKEHEQAVEKHQTKEANKEHKQAVEKHQAKDQEMPEHSQSSTAALVPFVPKDTATAPVPAKVESHGQETTQVPVKAEIQETTQAPAPIFAGPVPTPAPSPPPSSPRTSYRLGPAQEC